jgi:hypothetical protein
MKKEPHSIVQSLGLFALLSAAILALLYGLYIVPSDWTGVGGGGRIVVTSEKKDKSGTVTEKTITITPQDPNTLWDWLSLLGVPLVLTMLGYKIQQLEREQTHEHAKETALLDYLDQVSKLVLEKELISKAKAVHSVRKKSQEYDQISLDEKGLLITAAKDIIRARTLSILRLLVDDGRRKGAVMRFLVEANVISQLKLDLSNADLAGADLKGIRNEP